MALNEVYAEADSLNYVVPASTVTGNFVVLGGVAAQTGVTGIVGVAEVDGKTGDDGALYATLRHVGVFTGTTVAVGAPLYLASAAKRGTALTTTATANYFVGRAVKSKSGVAGNVHVRINN
jgi:hypothetical protein